MGQLLLLRGAKQLLTLRGPAGVRRGRQLLDLGLIRDGALLIRDGIIEEVGSSRRVESLAAAKKAEEISAEGRVVMPAFVDANFIAASAKFDFDAANLPVEHSLTRVETNRIIDDAILNVRESVSYGTTTVNLSFGGYSDLTRNINLVKQAAKFDQCHIGFVSTMVIRLSPEHQTQCRDAQWLAQLRHSFDTLRRRRLVQSVTFETPMGLESVAGQFLDTAAQSDLPCHLLFTDQITDRAFELTNHSAVASLQFAHPRVLDTSASLCHVRAPIVASPNMSWAAQSGQLQSLRKFLNRGGAVALASGYRPSIPSTFNMQSVVAMAVLLSGMMPEEAIQASTIQSAIVTGQSTDRGSLEKGKRADLLMLNLSDYRDMIWHTGVNHAAQVMRGGESVMNRITGRFKLD